LRFYKKGMKLVDSSVDVPHASGKTGLGAGGAEEFRLLEAVAREQLVKTADSKRLSGGAVVICELWRVTVAL
jgi:hypothetical protein